MIKWEYLSIDGDLGLMLDSLNKVGEESWELVSVCVSMGHYLAVFKRPITDPDKLRKIGGGIP